MISSRRKWDEREINKMRFMRRHGWTLDQIGDYYGITGERVRQLIGNTGHQPSVNDYRVYIMSALGYTVDEMAKHLGIHPKSVQRVQRRVRGKGLVDGLQF